MTEPTIERETDVTDPAQVYRLRIPDGWLVTARWPRLMLSYWLLRMIWGGAHP